jgi:signal transduction histidine kinase
MGEFDLLVGLTARLASTARLDDVVGAVVHELVALGFEAVWIAVLEEQAGNLVTLCDILDGVASPTPFAATIALDTRQPLGKSFRERRVINVADPAALHIIEAGDDDADAADDDVPADRLALPRQVFDYLRGRPFACGPALGSRGQPVGAIVLSSYRGAEPIPDAVLAQGLVRALIDHLGIAMERELLVARLARLDASLAQAQASTGRDRQLRAVGELSAGVAHDLNNLCGISMLAVSVGARSPADAFEEMPRIERANRAIRDLVGRLQRAGRPPAGEPEIADLVRVVDDLLVMLGPALREHAIELDAELVPVPPVACDPVLILQVVLNLVLNARDALAEVPPERRAIKIRVRDDGGVVRMIVADTGPGIAPEIRDRLFQPFATTRRDAHLGLGLATSRTSLAHYGATIDARTLPTGGAVFEVTLLAAGPARGAEPAPDGEVEPAPAAGDLPVQHPRILAVDDDPDVVIIIRTYLEPLGYEITTATSSAQALEAAASEPFDLVLCDIGMPKHSGPEVCRLMRQTGYRGTFVLMTGWDSQSIPTEDRADGWEAMLKKPFVGTELIQVIDSVLRRKR